MTATGRSLDKLLLGHGSARAEQWQARRSTGQRQDAMVDPSTGQIAEGLPPGVILTVPASAWATDARDDAVLGELADVDGAQVLPAPIGVVNEAWSRASGGECHVQRIGRELGAQMIGE